MNKMREDVGSSSLSNGCCMVSRPGILWHGKGRIKLDGSRVMVRIVAILAMTTMLSSRCSAFAPTKSTSTRALRSSAASVGLCGDDGIADSVGRGESRCGIRVARCSYRQRCRRHSHLWLSLASSPSTSSSRKKSRKEKQSGIRTKMTVLSTPPPPPPSEERSSSWATISDYRKQDQRSMESEILRLIRSGRTLDALSLYQSIWQLDDTTAQPPSGRGRPCRPSTRLMNHAILACAKNAPGPMIERAFEILEFAMKGGARGVRRLSPNVYTFGALVKACALVGDVPRCVGLIEQMREEFKIQPNAVIYSTAIAACGKCRPPQPDTAIALLQECVNPPQQGEARMDGAMNIVGYNAALSVCAVGGRWEMALQLLDEMNEDCGGPNKQSDASKEQRILHASAAPPAPDSVTYGTVMAACERSKQWEGVLALARVMEGLEESSSNTTHAIRMDGMALTTALHACQHLGLGQHAVHYLNKMKLLPKRTSTAPAKRTPLHGPDAVAYLLAISACARASHWKQGLCLLHEMEAVTGRKPGVVAYTSAITGCATAGEYRHAIRLMEEMQADDSGSLTPNVVTYSAVIRACATACVKAGARRRQHLRLDPESGLHSETDWDAQTGWATNQYTTDSQDHAVFSSSLPPSSVEEPLRAALALLRQMTHNHTAVQPNIVTYNAAMLACAEALDIQKAFQLFSDLQSRGFTPTEVTYGTLMLACERVGSVNGVLKIFKHMKLNQITPNEIIYGTAISCFRKAGQPERAATLLCKMVTDGLLPNIATFNTVLTALTENNRDLDLDKALTVYKILTSAKHVPQSTQPSHQTYNILVRAMAQNGRPDKAEFFLTQMSKNGFVPEVDLFTLTVASYEKNSQPLKALKVMESMTRDGYDFYEIKVLNSAFKRLVKLANVVGETLSSTPQEAYPLVDADRDAISSLSLEMEDSDINGISFEEGDFVTER